MNNLKSKFMAFKNIFKDNNDINEKSVIGIYVIFSNDNICISGPN